MFRRLLAFISFVSMACFHTPPQPTDQDFLEAGCDSNVHSPMGVYCTCLPSSLPRGDAEPVRPNSKAQRSTCQSQLPEPLEGCVARLQAKAQTQDPQANERRGKAKALADGTRQDVAFKKRMARWVEAYNGVRLVCLNAKASPTYRECWRWCDELQAVEKEHSKDLTARGFDPRDFLELGLWPASPDGFR